MSAIEDTSALPAEAPTRRLPSPRMLILWALIVTFCVVPFGLVLAISFGQKIEGAAWEWAFTGENYLRFFVGADWPESRTTLYLNRLWYSIYYAVIAALIAVLTAFPFAYLLTRLSRRAQSRWLVFLLATMSLSEVFIVMGWDILLSNRSGLPMVLRETGVTAWLKDVGWFAQLREWGLANPRDVKFKTSMVATVLTMSYLVWPYAVILLYPALSRLDQSTVEAARTMGAGPWTVMRTVVLPTVRLPLVGTVFLLFVFLLGTYVSVTVFADPSQQTLAISVYEAVRGSTLNAPFGAAQAVILLITGALCLWLGRTLVARTGTPA
ncbi:ABC transporter permease subunit [uncultured Roseobacter sp.]|uniref:ABC transporter permease n=1 Tax=uncultured Roseobacter sp. TaxID=114847 RepID=UPI002603ED9C|nr:ABC transporter permease subunit [uncultured Roseobacter sp.]